MKTIKITYWTSTALVALMMAFSAYAYFTQPKVAEGFQHLGYPGYFRVELGIAKLLAAIALLAPFGSKLKEWAYAGLSFTFVSAFIAHTASGDPAANRLSPLIFLAVLAISYVTLHKVQAAKSVASA